jgi:antitoxin (DNA-binding transcriptional repressor) of toxin-antitoxin stability system
MKHETLSATKASRNFSDLINKTLYMKQTTTLLRGGQPVAKVIPIDEKTITGSELAKRVKSKNLTPEENAEDWMLPVKEFLSTQKLPDIQWD